MDKNDIQKFISYLTVSTHGQFLQRPKFQYCLRKIIAVLFFESRALRVLRCCFIIPNVNCSNTTYFVLQQFYTKREDQQDATITCLSQIKHQLDITLCRFYFCRVTLHVSGVKRPSSGVLKNWHGGPWYWCYSCR